MPVARIKPYDPRRGLKIQTYVYQGAVFKESAGWYEVKPALAKVLKSVRNDAENPESPLAFDVFDDEEAALAFETEQLRRSQERASAAHPLRMGIPRADVSAPRQRGQALDLNSDDLAAEVARSRKPRTRMIKDNPDTSFETEAEEELSDEAGPDGAPSPAAPVAARTGRKLPGQRR